MKDQKENFINDQFFEIKIMLLSGCEELCNRALRYDEASRQAFAKLEGKSIAVSTYIDLSFTRSEFEFLIRFCESGLIFTSLSESDSVDDADVAIKASSFQLFSRLLSQRGLLDGDLEIKGDRTLVSQVQSILFNLELDWEEPLSNITGDIVAHELGRFAHDVSGWIKNPSGFFETLFSGKVFDTRNNSKRFTSEKYSVEKNDFNSFQQEVNELTNLQEKMATRAKHLFSKYQKSETQSEKNKRDIE